jgi:DNA-binding LytR/AlgR family response regulator
VKYKVLIVEDEVLISEHLKRIVQNSGYRTLEICGDYAEAMELLQTETPDLAFLDIRMNGVDEGVEVAKHLRSQGIPFIFITSFSDKETLQKAVKQQPLGYVLKPFTKEEIQEHLKVLEAEVTGNFITIGSANNKERIPIKEILWLRSENVYIEIQCMDKLHVHRGKLNEIYETLPPHLFVRTSQSYIVNLSHLSSISSDTVFIGEHKIPLSKKYKKAVFEQFAEF